jgi:tetratricopeptide (TPR) repeat protein
MARAPDKRDVERNESSDGYRQIVQHSIEQIDRAWSYYRLLFVGIGLLIVTGLTVFTILYTGNMRDVKASLASDVNAFERQVEARIDQEFETERVRRLIEDAASKQVRNAALPLIKRDMNDLVTPQMQEAQRVAATIGDQIVELKASLAETEHRQKEFAAQVATLALFYKVRQGSRDAYAQLTEIVESGTDEEKVLGASLLDEIGTYYQDLKRSLYQRTVILRMTGIKYHPHAERLREGIFSKDLPHTTREAYVNEIAARQLSYFVEDLIRVVREDADLRVAARAAKTIGTLTGQDFNCVPPFSDTLEWWDTIGVASDAYRSPFVELDRCYQTLKAGDEDAALAGLLDMVRTRPALSDARLAIAKICLRRNENEKAIEQFEAIDAESEDHNESLIRYAVLLVARGDKGKACDVLEKVKKFAPDREAFIRTIRGAKEFQPLAGEDRFKSLVTE